jgi:hypothetical protein
VIPPRSTNQGYYDQLVAIFPDPRSANQGYYDQLAAIFPDPRGANQAYYDQLAATFSAPRPGSTTSFIPPRRSYTSFYSPVQTFIKVGP